MYVYLHKKYDCMFRIKEILKDSLIDGKKATVVLLAEKVGLPQPNMSNIVNNKANPSWENLQKIANALNVGVKDLFEDDGIVGFVKANGVVHEISSIRDIEDLLEKLKF